MVSGPFDDGGISPCSRTVTARFRGDVGDVTAARLTAERFLDELTGQHPPSERESRDDILLTVSELAANAVQYAPGPFVLHLRSTFDGIHVCVGDTNPAPPVPRSCDPARGAGGIGWHLIQALSREVGVLREPDGKEIHVFLAW
ncbi:ATP-binding protein [Streptomyces albidochromogenes]|uniref:ATP-binding protein n=1 Tax=Streptomyces albidochromogenes TaxID=329524 RepID=A0ABW6FVQ0_9ACTN